MKAIWAYRDWSNETMDSGRAGCDLKDYPLETISFIASLFSFIRFAPTFKRIIYCDQSVSRFLDRTGISKLLDEKYVVSFKKKIDIPYPTLGKFFAYPKIWAYSQLDEPGFIVDTDLILKEPVTQWLDLEKYYMYYYYDKTANRIPESASIDEIGALTQGSKCSPSFRSFADYSNTCNAGLIYFADSRTANVVGHTLLSMGIELQEFLDAKYFESLNKGLCWTLYEESPMKNLIEFVTKQEVQEIPKDAYVEMSIPWSETVTLQAQENIVKDLAKDLQFGELIKYWKRISKGWLNSVV